MRKSLRILIAFIIGIVTVSCSKVEPSSDVCQTLMKYKWVLTTSEEPLVDDDNEWAIFDDYVITLYFVSDYECLIYYYRKHFDTDDGVSYTRDAQTVKYSVNGMTIFLEDSKYTGSEFVYSDDYLSCGGFIYFKEEITSSDRECIDDNYEHIELAPDKETSTAFYGLKEIWSEKKDAAVFGNPHCDEKGRLVYYETLRGFSMKYEYKANTIESKFTTDDRYYIYKYNLTNGRITSFVEQSFDSEGLRFTYTFEIKYDSKGRMIHISRDSGGSVMPSMTFYNFKWNAAGDIYESNTVYRDETAEPSYVESYEYSSTEAKFPCMILGMSNLWWAIESDIDPMLLKEGYFGESMPKHDLKSRYVVMTFNQSPYERYTWNYHFDKNGQLILLTQEFEDLYHGNTDSFDSFKFKWE